jgi:hypothetical protein
MGGVSLEYPSLLCSRVNPETAPYTSRQLRGADSGAFALAASDMKLARGTRTNVLIVGPADALSLVIGDLKSDATVECGGGRLQLPAAASRPGTVVVRDVDVLTPVEQRRLLEWLDASSIRPQVVTTASVPLLPRVEARGFNDVLYYRLNTIYIDLSD